MRTDSLFKGFTQDGGYTTNYLEVGGNQNDVGLIYSFGQTLANIPVRLSLLLRLPSVYECRQGDLTGDVLVVWEGRSGDESWGGAAAADGLVAAGLLRLWGLSGVLGAAVRVHRGDATSTSARRRLKCLCESHHSHEMHLVFINASHRLT